MKKTLLTLLTATLFTLHAEGFHIDGVKTMLNEAKLMVSEVNATTLKKMLDGDDDFFIVDLRGNNQVARGEIYHIDSFKIDRGYLEFQVETKIPDKKAIVVVYCCSGKRSLLAAQSMIKMGYKHVYSLKGGIKGWVDQGMPLDTTYGEMIINKD